MTSTAEDFNQFCHDAAGRFLQTVVVIDNEAIFCETPCNFFEQESVQIVHKPSTGVLGGHMEFEQENSSFHETMIEEDSPGIVECGEQAEATSKNILKAAPLINAFADKGVICSIIRPDIDDEKVIERAVTVASVADIVVVDWKLGNKEGEAGDLRAKEIIKGIIERDLKKNGRLRLIAIYTAEDNPGLILDEIYDHIKGLAYPDSLSKEDNEFTIQNRFLKIVVLLKSAAGEHIPGISPINFKELPGKLQELFAKLNSGLLPSVTLRAIASIREGTHHLLAVLHKDLDPALVGHRCLLPYPKDAEEFCEDLVAGEIRSALAMAKIGSDCAGKTQNELWVASRLSPELTLNYDEYRATPEQISILLEKGDEQHKPFISYLKREWAEHNQVRGKKAPPFDANLIPQFFYGQEADGEKCNREFARLTSFKREAFGLRQPPINWLPKLTLGTVLQRIKDGKIFICLQPRCESVRLDKNERRAFPFLEMEKGKQIECIITKVVNNSQEIEEKELYFQPKPRNQAVFEFKSTTGHSIIAKKNDIFYIFSANRTKFYWLGDLKDPFAQNIVNKVSDEVGSVGIDPFEWQRRKGK